MGNYSHMSVVSQCQRECWQAFPALFSLNCFTCSVTAEGYVRLIMAICSWVDCLYNVGVNTNAVSLAWCNFAAVWSILFSSAHLSPSCRQKDSKDEVAKAEKEFQEIHKVIEESGGKLSNRLLQCDVRMLCFFEFRSPFAFHRWQMKRWIDG